MLSILAIFAWWYRGRIPSVHRENNDLLPVNFGRDFQLPESELGIHMATNNDQPVPGPPAASRVSRGTVQRVPVPRLKRINRHRSTESSDRSWNPGLPIHNQFIGQIIQELRQMQLDDSQNDFLQQNQPLQGTIYALLENNLDVPASLDNLENDVVR